MVGGVRLFDHLVATPAVLGNLTITQGVGVTHLRYPVVTRVPHSDGERQASGPAEGSARE